MSFVICVSLETGLYAVTQAGADGGFSVTLFAPPGSSVLIKVDPAGRKLPSVLTGEPVIDHHFNELISLPGTILRVPEPTATTGEIAFGAAGVVRTSDMFAPWSLRGTLARSRFQPGETVDVRLTVAALASPSSPGTARVRAQLSLTPLSAPDGTARHAQNSFCSTVLTPTGLPIERSQWLFTSFQAPEVSATFTQQADSIRAELQMSLRLREDLPPGYYRPAMVLNFENLALQPQAGRRLITFIDNASRSISSVYLPVIRIGEPRAPRLIWTLLMNTPRQGGRGVIALEDQTRFRIASHITTAADRVVVPRVDARSGQAIVYNLEPFAPTIAIGDRGAPPGPPLIPFRFPSGQLKATIRAPNGSVSVLGPVPFRQDLLVGAARPDGSSLEGGPSISDPYQLTTLDPQFNVQFGTDGLHRIELEGTVEDIWGNVWSSSGSFEIDVARDLVIDPFPIPGTPFEVGDRLGMAITTHPPVPAEVELRFRFAPRSDPTRMVTRTTRGRANRFGFVSLSDATWSFEEPGEYRVDLLASYVDASGARWAGTLTWGSVVAPRSSLIEAHGRRGIDDQPEGRQPWFFRTQTGLTFGRGHVHIPFHSGDVMWMEEPDAATVVITFHDVEGRFTPILRQYCCRPQPFDQRAQDGETPLFSANLSGLDVHLTDSTPDIHGYSYRAVERPLVRVRELIGEDGVTVYWRFQDLYGSQLGTGANGDLPNDFKFQFGGAVLRGRRIGEPQYSIYGSLFVLVPQPDPGGGTRIFPPFQGNVGPSGGPLFKLKGKDIDLFFHPTGVRPGTILEIRNLASFAGQIGPTLPSKVEVVVTSPSGQTRMISGQANKIGYFYQPSTDFRVYEEGVWRAKVKVWHDGRTSGGQLVPPFPTGDVLGSREGEFYFYVVSSRSPQPAVNIPPHGFVRPAERPVSITLTPPSALANVEMHYTVVMPGFILEEGRSSSLTYTYDATRLARDFPNLDLHDADNLAGVDPIMMSFLISGTDASGQPRFFARQVLLQGETLLALESSPSPPRRRGAGR